ncbi:MAG: hypothetical protein ACRD51_07870 [Candidatus Acidiferrum sp.]
MERPTGVTILAVLYFFGAAFSALAALIFFAGGSMLSSMAGPAAGMFLSMGGVVLGAIFIGIAILDVAIAVGFLKLQNWARIVAIVFTGLALLRAAFSLLTLFLHFHVFGIMITFILAAIEIWILVYLFKPHVKQAFGATSF